MKKEVNFIEILKETIDGLKDGRGLLCSIDGNGRPNAMAIGWGNIGIVWGRPVFIVFVRPSRYTYFLIEETGDFTVNIAEDDYKEVVNYFGSVSGRNVDKFKESGLNLIESKNVKSPIIKECFINFECRIIAKTDINPDFINGGIKKEIYPSGNYHRVYFGEILNVYKGY